MDYSGTIKEKDVIRLSTPPSVDEFVNKYLIPGVPVVIENGFKNWKANEWTIDYLDKKCGDNNVHVRKFTRSSDYRSGKKYGIEEMSFSSYIKELSKKEKCNYYMAVQNIKRALPQLNDDIILPEYVGKVHMGPYLWIAPEKHYEYTHFDPDDGLLFIISGQKTVKLFHWKYLENMYPNPFGSKGRTIQSQVDLNNINFKQYPLFKDVECDTCVLKTGDMLFIPAFYFHQVTSDEVTISVNVFFGDKGESNYINKIIDGRFDILVYWISNIVEQNRSYPSYLTLMAHLDKALKNFIFKQWHEIIDDDKLQILTKEILQKFGFNEKPEKVDDLERKHIYLKIRGLLWRD